MVVEKIASLLKEKFPDAILEAAMGGGHPHVLVEAVRWPEVALFLCTDPRLELNLLRCITAVDRLEAGKFALIYDLMRVATDRGSELVGDTHEFAVRVETDRTNPHVPTVSHVWPAADWHEREAMDLMGVRFDGHPDPRRILCPDDWVGHPLRKDYEYPLEYHGIPGTTEYDLPNPVH